MHDATKHWKRPKRKDSSKQFSLTFSPDNSLLTMTQRSLQWLMNTVKTTGLPGAIREISGPNCLVNFRTFFVGFTRLKTQKMHVFLYSKILLSQADQ